MGIMLNQIEVGDKVSTRFAGTNQIGWVIHIYKNTTMVDVLLDIGLVILTTVKQVVKI
jgi:hypothetical protein